MVPLEATYLGWMKKESWEVVEVNATACLLRFGSLNHALFLFPFFRSFFASA